MTKNSHLAALLSEFAEKAPALAVNMTAALQVHAAAAVKTSKVPATAANEWRKTLEWWDGTKLPAALVYAGIERLRVALREKGFSQEQMAARFAVSDVHTAGFCPQKGCVKAPQLFAVIGGAREDEIKVPRQARILDAHIENACRAFVNEWILSRGKKDPQTGRFVKRDIYAGVCEYRQQFGYKALIDAEGSWKIDPELSARIDAAIEEGAASYGTSTINTQSGQVKSLLLAIGAATVMIGGREVDRAFGEDGQVLKLRSEFAALLFEIDRTTHPFVKRDVTRNARS